MTKPKEDEDCKTDCKLDPSIESNRAVGRDKDNVPPGRTMNSAPAIRDHRVHAVLVEDEELDGDAESREDKAHEEEAQEAGFVEAGIGALEDCGEFFAVLAHAVHDQY